MSDDRPGAAPAATRPADVGARARQPIRRTVRVSMLLAIGAAGFVAWHLPTHRYAERPGGILDLAARITIDDETPVTPIDGRFDGLTVSLHPLDLGALALHTITGDSSVVVREDQIRPPGISPDVYDAYEKAAYVDGGQIAAAVAERALGRQATVTSDGVEVFEVQHGSAADGALAVGDVITAVDGGPVTADTDLSGAIDRAGGAAVTLTARSAGGAERTVSVTPRRSPDGTRWLLGVVVGPANPQVRLEIPVTIDAGNVEGPSAGLMTALTVYDMLSPVDVAAGRSIAGTGTLAVDGTVGDIGGIEAKARAAEAAGADLFLAPADQAQDARAVLGDRVPVIGVDTFAAALSALGVDGAVGSAPATPATWRTAAG